MKKKRFLLAIFFIICFDAAMSQDTLPNFTVRTFGNGKAQVSWINSFDKIVQLTVQRSFDSTKFFRTIFSSQSPWLPQNGFIDNAIPAGYRVFYRIQYVFEGGSYFFTKSLSPTVYKPLKVAGTDDEPEPSKPLKPGEKRMVKIYKRNKETFVTELEYNEYKKFRDSIAKNTKDTLYYTNNDEVVIKPFVPKQTWRPSSNIFTNDKGYVNIVLPLAKQKHYRIVFLEENGSEIFQIKHVKEPELVLDKANFIHAGWFFFELYEDDKLKEKNKFYLWKD
ncbi:MAG: hypothetical protein H7178_01475 [Chitinophagaceae bacterium]|nr:hypothetical protein [Chitinophagaceae bacterium]